MRFRETAHFDLIYWNVAALAAIERFRAPVYDTPRLTRGTGVRTTQGKKAPDTEHRRRENTRELNEELSRYYQLATNQEAWGCPELVLKGKYDVITPHQDIPLTRALFQSWTMLRAFYSHLLSHLFELRLRLRVR